MRSGVVKVWRGKCFSTWFSISDMMAISKVLIVGSMLFGLSESFMFLSRCRMVGV